MLCVNYCSRVRGTSLKILLQRCRNLKCLLLQQTNLDSESVQAAEWEKAEQLQVGAGCNDVNDCKISVPLFQELDITATDLSKECLLDFLPRIPAIRFFLHLESLLLLF